MYWPIERRRWPKRRKKSKEIIPIIDKLINQSINQKEQRRKNKTVSVSQFRCFFSSSFFFVESGEVGVEMLWRSKAGANASMDHENRGPRAHHKPCTEVLQLIKTKLKVHYSIDTEAIKNIYETIDIISSCCPQFKVQASEPTLGPRIKKLQRSA